MLKSTPARLQQEDHKSVLYFTPNADRRLSGRRTIIRVKKEARTCCLAVVWVSDRFPDPFSTLSTSASAFSSGISPPAGHIIATKGFGIELLYTADNFVDGQLRYLSYRMWRKKPLWEVEERERERGAKTETDRQRETERDRERETETKRERVYSPKHPSSTPQPSCPYKNGQFALQRIKQSGTV